MDNVEQSWSAPIAADDIPDAGRHIDLEAPETAREAVARLGALRALPRLTARFDLTRQGGRVHVIGQVSARVGQTCVVTLEAIENDVEETIELVFAPSVDAGKKTKGEGSKSAWAKNDGPEPLVGGVIDLGAVATEFLLLGIDPYPRKPGVEFAPLKSDNPGSHPFAALEVLKKRSRSD